MLVHSSRNDRVVHAYLMYVYTYITAQFDKSKTNYHLYTISCNTGKYKINNECIIVFLKIISCDILKPKVYNTDWEILWFIIIM